MNIGYNQLTFGNKGKFF